MEKSCAEHGVVLDDYGICYVCQADEHEAMESEVSVEILEYIRDHNRNL